MAATALTLDDVEFTYRRSAAGVRIEHLDLSAGVHALVGANGSGKTTLLKLAAGLLVPHRGTIALDGSPVAGPEGRGSILARSAYLPQDYTLTGRTTVEAFLRYGAWLRGVPVARLHDRADEILDQVALDGVRGTAIGRLSGGMQRRLGLAVELSAAPDLCLLDEPTSGLDRPSRHAMHGLVRRLASEGAVVVLATHDDSEIAAYEADVHVLRRGRLVRTHRGPQAPLLDELLHEAG